MSKVYKVSGFGDVLQNWCLLLLLVLLLSLDGRSGFSATIVGDTSHPDASTFALGDPVELNFKVSGMVPLANQTLQLDIRDAYGESIDTISDRVSSDADGNWTGTVNAPKKRLGFYRVYCRLSDGTSIQALGSRPAGFLTYAVVPDPRRRPDYGEAGDMFGMQGGFNTKVNVIPYLGIRWVLGNYGFAEQEKLGPGEFKKNYQEAVSQGRQYPVHPETQEIFYHGERWKTYVLPCLDSTPLWAGIPETFRLSGGATAALNERGEAEWPIYCCEAAKAFQSNFPDYSHDFYQVTWEPVYPWGYRGSVSQLIRIYKLAYPALHAADPKAIVLGPTDGGIGGPDLEWTENLLKAGLGQYIDGITIHPYFNINPESNGLIEAIRTLRATVDSDAGKILPFYGTEQGYDTRGNVNNELLQAQGLVRQHLIMLGEGYRVNFAFYVTDFRPKGCGYFYNLDKSNACGAAKCSPKPVVAAFAAMTYLIDGHRPVKCIENLGQDILGYSFQNGKDIVLALWNYGGDKQQISIPVGVSNVVAYDWMGNATAMNAHRNSIKLILSAEPTYIRGVSPYLWGKN